MADLRFAAALVLGFLALSLVEGRYEAPMKLHGSLREIPRSLPHRRQHHRLRLNNGLGATPPMGCGFSFPSPTSISILFYGIIFTFGFLVVNFLHADWSSHLSLIADLLVE